jgi:hypothetical protein
MDIIKIHILKTKVYLIYRLYKDIELKKLSHIKFVEKYGIDKYN